MINKQNLWFVTLFSLIIVLSIYYISMSDSTLANITQSVKENEEQVETVINESTALVALRVEADEKTLAEMKELQQILLNEEATVEEKNEAYSTLQTLNQNKGKEEDLENILKNEFQYQAFIKINGDQIDVVIASTDHNATIANNIIQRIQKEFDVKKYITVKFQ